MGYLEDLGKLFTSENNTRRHEIARQNYTGNWPPSLPGEMNAWNKAYSDSADQYAEELAKTLPPISDQDAGGGLNTSDGAPPGTSPSTTLFPRFNIFGNDPDSIQSTIPTSFPGGRDIVDVSVEEAEAAVAANFTPEERAAWEAAFAENIGNLTGDDPDLTGNDPDLEGTAAADDLQIQSILSQATGFTADGFAAVFEELELDELNENLGKIEKEYVKRLQNELLRGGGVGWEFNPEEGDSIFFKLPVVIPGMSGIMKIKIKNPDGTFKTAGEIAAETRTQIETAVQDVAALPGKLMEQAGEILGQGGDLAEILAGTSDKTLEEVLGDIFGGIFEVEGETDTSGVWDILIGKLTEQTIANESEEGGLLWLDPADALKTDEELAEAKAAKAAEEAADEAEEGAKRLADTAAAEEEAARLAAEAEAEAEKAVKLDEVSAQPPPIEAPPGPDDPFVTCFIAGTKIDMANGTQKNIEDIKVGDKVQAIAGKTDTVSYVHDIKIKNHVLWTLNGHITATESHPFLTEKGWKSANPVASLPIYKSYGIAIGKLEVGDLLIGSEGVVELTKLKSRKENVKVYNFTTASTHTYMVDGIVSHNKTPAPVVIKPDDLDDPDDPGDSVVEPPPPSPPPPPEPPPSGGGGGGGGGGGFASGRVIGEAPMLQLPAFRPVMPQQKDYTVALNNIIQESLFEGMI